MVAAREFITVTDESIYSSAQGATLPLIFIATQEDKTIPGSSEIAPNTTKTNANKYSIVNGQRDLVQKYGAPFFRDVQGTIQQGDELNEYGLWTAWSLLGLVGTVIIVRADIDLAQLEMTQTRPSANPTNGTMWFDLTNTSFGVFRANGSTITALAWDSVPVQVPSLTEISGGIPLSSFGSNGQIAVVAYGTTGTSNILFEKVNGSWEVIGSDAWSDQHPTIIVGTIGATYTNLDEFSINGTTVTLSTGTTVADAIIDINNAAIVDIVASNASGALQITNTNGNAITIVEVTGTPATALGLPLGTTNGVSLTFSTHANVPSGETVNSIWVKTTEPNNGAKWVVKEFLTSTNQWTELAAPMYSSAILAEIGLGGSLGVGSLFVNYVTDVVDGIVAQSILEYATTGGLTVTGSTITPATNIGDIIDITVANGSVVQTYSVTFTGITLTQAINDIDAMNIPDLEVQEDVTGAIKFIRSTGKAIQFAENTGTSLSLLGIDEGEYSKWTQLVYEANTIAPTVDPEDETLWINDDFQVDIMINDGDEWIGLLNSNPTWDPAGVQLTSAEPTKQSDGSPLVTGDLWIDTSDTENYPSIYRWLNGAWEAIDKTDQTTAFGIVFSDSRENAGPDYAGSTHTAFSEETTDMLISDYVDPDAPDPRTYAAGTLLFNTRYSTNNVKEWQSTYFKDAIKTYPLGTFQVGNSSVFPVPGTVTNTVISRWVTASGNDLQGAMYAGRKAQRAMVVKALAASIVSNEEIRSEFLEYNIVATPGYFEVYDEMVGLVTDKKETAFIVTDTPPRLRPDGTVIQQWATNANNAPSNGEEGRITRYTYSTMCYPWGLGTNYDGSEVMIPSSAIKLRTIAYSDSVAYPWFPAAGVRRGIVTNATSVGYLTSENEYSPIILSSGLQDILDANNINPIKFDSTAGLVVWGDKTLHPYSSALDRENVARLIVHIRTDFAKLAKPFFFELNTERTRNDFKGVLEGYLADLVTKEGLYDFLVVCDDSNNTPTRIDRHELWADCAIEPTKSINWIYIPIRILNTGEISGGA